MPLDLERWKRRLQAAALALTLPAASLLIWGVISFQRQVVKSEAEARHWVDFWQLEGIFELSERARRGDDHALRQLTALAPFSGEGDGKAVGLGLLAIARFQPQRLLRHFAGLPAGGQRDLALRMLLYGAMEDGPDPEQVIAGLKQLAVTPTERQVIADLRRQLQEILH